MGRPWEPVRIQATDLPRVDLPWADLPRADLRPADLPRVDLQRVDLPRAGFRLKEEDFQWALRIRSRCRCSAGHC